MKRITLTTILFFTFIMTQAQIVDGVILNSKESNNDPYIELLKQASISGQKNENDKAIDYLNQATILKPNEAVGYSQRAHLRIKMNDIQNAIDDFTKFIELAPKSRITYGYYGRGQAKFKLNDYEGAISDFKKSISLKPDYGYAYYQLGLVYLKTNDLEKACDNLTKAKDLKVKESKKIWKGNCNK